MDPANKILREPKEESGLNDWQLYIYIGKQHFQKNGLSKLLGARNLEK
jgi:hypothetical protein